MTTISAKSILSSMHAITGDRLDTLLLRYPRFIHAEFMTHRKFSRNAASSRAIPVTKLIDDVEADPASPVVWTRNEPGMQASEMLSNGQAIEARHQWMLARVRAVHSARELAKTGAHKQIVNRVLEPFAHITVVVSASDWSGFLAQRDHKDAEPHMQMLAQEIREALEKADTQVLAPGEWHLPFVEWRERKRLLTDEALILSVARCASTSYKTVDGFDMTMDRAQAVYVKLRTANPMHASPFEHAAMADYMTDALTWGSPEQHRNFIGFRQFRAMIEEDAA